MKTRVMLAALLLSSVLPFAEGAGPIRDAAVFAKRLGATRARAARDHLVLAKRMRRKHRLEEALAEVCAALVLRPEDRTARRLLEKIRQEAEGGKARKGDRSFADDAAKLRRKIAGRFADLAARGADGGLDAEARRAASLALDAEPDCEEARKILGHEGRAGDWKSPRERELQALFARAGKSARAGDTAPDALSELESTLGVTLVVRRTEHAIVAVAAGQETLEEVAKSVDAARSTFLHFFLGVDLGEQGRRETTGGKKRPPPIFLVLGDQASHGRFVASYVRDEGLRKMAAHTRGVTGTWQRHIVYECWFPASLQVEWAAHRMAVYLLCTSFKGKKPDWIVDGVGRFVAGRVSGRAAITYVVPRSMEGKRKNMKGSSFASLRAAAREAAAGFEPPPLMALLQLGVNTLTRPKVALAEAFIDFSLATRREALLAFLAHCDTRKEMPLEPFASAYGESVEAVGKAFRAWVREMY